MVEKTEVKKAVAKEEETAAPAASRLPSGKLKRQVDEMIKMLNTRFPTTGDGWQSPLIALPSEADANHEGKLWYVEGREHPDHMPWNEVEKRGRAPGKFWCAWDDYVPAPVGAKKATA